MIEFYFLRMSSPVDYYPPPGGVWIIRLLYLCVCVLYYPPVREVCNNHEVPTSDMRLLQSLGSVAYRYIAYF